MPARTRGRRAGQLLRTAPVTSTRRRAWWPPRARSSHGVGLRHRLGRRSGNEKRALAACRPSGRGAFRPPMAGAAHAYVESPPCAQSGAACPRCFSRTMAPRARENARRVREHRDRRRLHELRRATSFSGGHCLSRHFRPTAKFIGAPLEVHGAHDFLFSKHFSRRRVIAACAHVSMPLRLPPRAGRARSSARAPRPWPSSAETCAPAWT